MKKSIYSARRLALVKTTVFIITVILAACVAGGCKNINPPGPVNTATLTMTRTAITGPSVSMTLTATCTATLTETALLTPAQTFTETSTKIDTCTETSTVTQTSTGIDTDTTTPSHTITETITDTATVTDTPTITCTATVTPTATTAIIGFDAGLQGWGNLYHDITSNKALYGAVWDATDGHSANGCLSSQTIYDSGTNTFTAYDHVMGEILYISPVPMDLAGHYFTAWIKIPVEMAAAAAAYTLDAYIIDSSGKSAIAVCPVPNTAGWTQISFSINGMISSDCDRTQIKVIGIRIYRIGSTVLDPSKDVFGSVVKLDDISY